VIYLPFKIKSVYMKNIADCKIYIGCVRGASLFYSVKNSEIHLCGH
jgi:hypothetical protein